MEDMRTSRLEPAKVQAVSCMMSARPAITILRTSTGRNATSKTPALSTDRTSGPVRRFPAAACWFVALFSLVVASRRLELPFLLHGAQDGRRSRSCHLFLFLPLFLCLEGVTGSIVLDNRPHHITAEQGECIQR
jgi:hypothetical protein